MTTDLDRTLTRLRTLHAERAPLPRSDGRHLYPCEEFKTGYCICSHQHGYRLDAGVNPAVTVHGLRHTALFLLELDGVPESVRMELGGHATTAMAKHYTRHATLEDVRRAIG